MITDRTFFTNEKGQTLLDRFKDIIAEDTKAFDVLVGYFNITGFHLLVDALEKVDNIRILVGMGIDKQSLKILNQYQLEYEKANLVQKETEKLLIDELNNSEDSYKVETGVRKFIEWIKNGKIQIKAYPENLHAKVYILSFDNKRDAGRVITGSSNFTKAGLKDNLEFNVELKNYSDYIFALEKFNNLWEKAIDINEKIVETVNKKSWLSTEISPYMLYLKFLYEYFKEEIDDDKQHSYFKLPSNFIELQYQKDAVIDAERKLKRYGGVIIADVVGLGKTFISALLMKKLNGKSLIIAPPKLIDNWKSILFDFGIPAEVISSGILSYDNLDYQKILDSDFNYIFIDEAHQFRNENTQKYDALKTLCLGKKLVLITATPYNNRPLDILSLIKLFQNPKNSDFINPEVKNLETYFKKLDKELKKAKKGSNYDQVVKKVAKDIRENVLKYILIRRTRKEIEQFYKEDLEKNNLKFPKIENPNPLFYEFDENLENLFNDTIKIITQKLKYARYKPLLYKKNSIESFLEESQKNLAGFMKAVLIKRIESSFEAFQSTLNSIIKGYELFISLYKNEGYIFFSKKHFQKIKDFIEKEDFEAIENLIQEGKAEKLPASDFKSTLLKDLNNDLKLLKDLKEKWKNIKTDPKLIKLINLLKQIEGKVILFTESEKTANYLYNNLKKDFKVFKFTGNSSKTDIEIVKLNFDANVKEESQLDDYNILITTDVLSEGINLHRSNKVVNYDIPWNPVKLIQRVGRVNRVGTKFEKIYIYNFFPTYQAEKEIELKKIAEMKLQTIIHMLGTDAKFLTENEKIDSHQLFKMLNSKELLENQEETNQEIKYLQYLRKIRDKDPMLFNQIKQIPKKARVGRKKQKDKKRFITFIKKADMKKIFYIDDTDIPKEIPFENAVNIFYANKKEQPVNITKEFYKYLDIAKKEFKQQKQIKIKSQGIEKEVITLLALLKNSGKWNNKDNLFLEKIRKLIENKIFTKYRLKIIKISIEKDIKEQNFKEALDKLKNLIPQNYIKYITEKEEKTDTEKTEIILSEIFI